MALVIETRSAQGDVSRTAVRAGTKRLTVRPGDVFRLYDNTTGKAPEGTEVRQLDNSIVIDHLNGDGAGTSTVVLSGFYSSCSVSTPCHLQLPASDNGMIDITASTPVADARPDGSFVLHAPGMSAAAVAATSAVGSGIGAAGGEAAGAAGTGAAGTAGAATDSAGLSGKGLADAGGAGAGGKHGATDTGSSRGYGAGPDTGVDTGTAGREADTAGNGHEPFINESSRPIIYGVGGAAVLGLALAGGGGGGGGDAPAPAPGAGAAGTTPTLPAPTPSAPAAPTVPPSTVDPKFVVTHSSVAKGKLPTLTGTGTAGATVKIDVDVTGDKTVDAAYTTTVDAAGAWKADLATLKPTTGTLPAGGLSSNTSLTLTETAGTTTATLPAFNLTADDTPPKAPTISPVATDNLISAAEATQPLAIGGTGDPDSLIKMTFGGQTYETTVGANGAWLVNVPSAAIPATGEATVSVTASDLAGNVSTATTQAVTVDKTPPVAPIVQYTGGTDNYVNAAEKAAGTTISGTAEANSTVKVTVGEISHEARTGADGKWSVAFAGAELPAADGSYVVSATATDAAGNASVPSAGVPAMVVDTKAPSITDVHAGTTDRVRQGLPFTVTGKAEAGSKIDVIYTRGDGGKVHHTGTAPDGTGDDAAWSVPVFVAYSTSLGATQQSLQVTATDKAGNVTTIEHKFVVLGTLSLFGAGEAQTTEAAGTTIKSLDGTDGHTAGLDAVQAAGMGNPSSADTLLASTADKATSATGATGITTSQTITLKTHDLLDAGSPKVEGALPSATQGAHGTSAEATASASGTGTGASSTWHGTSPAQQVSTLLSQEEPQGLTLH